ncbi:MAG: Nif3-like dinuclear metal center hexameric protein [Lachnospiraceae bacterium]|nr:Nif3-like dinuclear metal center hexameric protein [Lachnospiraceae bacterium]
MKCREVVEMLDDLSPGKYACDWDNVGLLVGRQNKEVHKIMVALDASKEIVKRAAGEQVDLLITHHPMIFSAIKRVNEEQFTSEKVLTLAENGICYYAMHTNFDTVGGMADLAAGKQYLNLSDVSPIDIANEAGAIEGEGMGRYGRLPKPMTAEEVAEYVKERFGISFVILYQSEAETGKVFDKIAVMPGSGKSVMKQVVANGYELYLTGDYGHHEGLDAMDLGLTVIDATHYGLEHIFVAYIAKYLREKLDGCKIEIVEADMGCPARVL